MTHRHFLYVYANGLVAVRDQGNGLEVIAQFAAEFTEDGAEQAVHLGFEAWVKDFVRDDFTVLIDVVEEDFHSEEVPTLRAADQREMIKRRVSQRYRDARLHQWSVVSSPRPSLSITSKPARGTTRVLISAVTKDQSVLPWLNSIERSKLAVREVSSPALLSMRLLKHVLNGRNGFVVSLLPGGLRQTLIINGEVQLTRLASDLRAKSVQAVQIEMLRTMQYLLMSQKLSRDRLRDAALPVYLLDAGIADAQTLPSHLAVDSSVDIPIVALSDGRESSVLAWCEWSLLSPTAGARRRGYVDQRLSFPFRLRATSRWLGRVGATALGIGLLSLGSAQTLRWVWPVQTSQHQLVSSRSEQQVNHLTQELGRYAVAGPEMRSVVELAASLEARHVDPMQVLQIVADGLAAFPQVDLRQLAWKRLQAESADRWLTIGLDGKDSEKTLGTPSGPVNGNALNPGSPLNLPPLGVDQTTTGQTAGSSAPARQGVVPEGPVLVDMQVRLPIDLPMQKANDLTEQFSKALSQACGCVAKATKLPFDPSVSSGFSKSFESSSGDSLKEVTASIRLLLSPSASGSIIVQQPAPSGAARPAG
jgi:hypothetical protein